MKTVAKKRLDLRLEIWFALNRTQQRKLSSLGYCHLMIEDVSFMDLRRVTNSTKIYSMLAELKGTFKLRLVA